MQGLFVHEQRLHSCGELPVVPCVLCVHQVATKACGSVVSPRGTGIAFRCSGCWCSAEVVPSQRRALPHRVSQPSGHPLSSPGHWAGAQGPAELLLSPAAWPGPPIPVSDRGCLSPSRVSAGPGPHPLERAARAALRSRPLRCRHHHSPALRCHCLPLVHLRAGARGHHPPAPAGCWRRYVAARWAARGLLPQRLGTSSLWICSLRACHLPKGVRATRGDLSPATLLQGGRAPVLPAQENFPAKKPPLRSACQPQKQLLRPFFLPQV